MCGRCGLVIPGTRHVGALYCSVECGVRAAGGVSLRAGSVEACDVCFWSFVMRSPLDRYCSDACRRVAINAKRQVARAEGRHAKAVRSDAMREAEHRKRARRRGAATGDRVVRSEIGDRDGWLCFCGGAVDRTLVWPDPGSASIDHVVPLSMGGAHDPGNVRISHLGCNVRRGAARGEELEVCGGSPSEV